MSNSDFITKDEVRGKRNTKNRTFKRFERHNFEDEHNIKGTAGKGHTHRHTEYVDDYDADDSPYADLIDWKKIK